MPAVRRWAGFQALTRAPIVIPNGQFSVRWDASKLSRDREVRVSTGDGGTFAQLFIGGKQRSSYGFFNKLQGGEAPYPVFSGSLDLANALSELATTGGGKLQGGVTYTGPTSIASGTDLNPDAPGISGDVKDGEVRMTAFRPGAKDIAWTGSYDTTKAGRYPEPAKQALAAAEKLAGILQS